MTSVRPSPLKSPGTRMAGTKLPSLIVVAVGCPTVTVSRVPCQSKVVAGRQVVCVTSQSCTD